MRWKLHPTRRRIATRSIETKIFYCLFVTNYTGTSVKSTNEIPRVHWQKRFSVLTVARLCVLALIAAKCRLRAWTVGPLTGRPLSFLYSPAQSSRPVTLSFVARWNSEHGQIETLVFNISGCLVCTHRNGQIVACDCITRTRATIAYMAHVLLHLFVGHSRV